MLHRQPSCPHQGLPFHFLLYIIFLHKKQKTGRLGYWRDIFIFIWAVCLWFVQFSKQVNAMLMSLYISACLMWVDREMRGESGYSALMMWLPSSLWRPAVATTWCWEKIPAKTDSKSHSNSSKASGITGQLTTLVCWMNNYIVRSNRDVIVVTKIATRRTSKAQSIVMY